MGKTRVMENVSLLTQKHLFITTTDKHGVPPTKRLFKVPTLDPSPEFIGPWGTSGDPGQPRLGNGPHSAGLKLLLRKSLIRVKERGLDPRRFVVENAVFDL
ncbi:hypothetical protein Tco_0213060 [Tanacetum coccineum]